jgi:hypothetical protein
MRERMGYKAHLGEFGQRLADHCVISAPGKQKDLQRVSF